MAKPRDEEWIMHDEVSLLSLPLAGLKSTGSASHLYCPHQQQCRWATPTSLVSTTASFQSLEELKIVLLEILQISLTCQLWGGPACLLKFCSDPVHALGIYTLVQVPLPRRGPPKDPIAVRVDGKLHVINKPRFQRFELHKEIVRCISEDLESAAIDFLLIWWVSLHNTLDLLHCILSRSASRGKPWGNLVGNLTIRAGSGETIWGASTLLQTHFPIQLLAG
mmetsp:Transcript_113943/g.198034  ORF Transcript_113943/g.198034 Transcript_113943/m.198034 type:complete len:222 (+) Transcript_113943:499-1164(+)